MVSYIIRRLLYMVPVIIGVSILVFFIIHLTPGDPARLLAGQSATPEVKEAIREKLGLNDHLIVQYYNFIKGAIKGDFGESFKTGRPVVDELIIRLPNTLALASISMIIALILGVIVGVIAAYKQYTFFDSGVMATTLLAVSMPGFWLGMLLMLLFALRLGWLPPSGKGGEILSLNGIKYLILPALTLGLRSAAVIARLTRSSMLEVLNQEYIRTARAKGLREKMVIFKHALKNSLIPVLTMAGIQFGDLLANTAIIETLFSWPGISRLGVNAIWSRDYPVIQGVVFWVALVFVLVNLLVDLLYAYLDPRIQYS